MYNVLGKILFIMLKVTFFVYVTVIKYHNDKQFGQKRVYLAYRMQCIIRQELKERN